MAMPGRVELDVVIEPDGTVRVDVRGAKGKACLEYLELMKSVLGTIGDRQLTAEYHETAAESAARSGVVRRRGPSGG